MVNVELQPRAEREARAAWRWYAKVSQSVAGRFASALDAAIAAIEANPSGQAPHLFSTRIVRLKGFPYILVFVEIAKDFMQVVAVAHTSRRPAYWRRRLP